MAVDNVAGSSIKDKIQHIGVALKEIVDPDYGLLDQLIALGVLTYEEYSDVSATTPAYRRIEGLLKCLTTKSEVQCTDFLTALERTDQQHVVNYIRHSGDFTGHETDARPLDPSVLGRIVANMPRLIEVIDSNIGFIADLYSSGSITGLQKGELVETHITATRNRKLLDIIRRRSIGHFRKFLDCLANNQQSFLVPLFLEKGVVVNIDAQLDETSVDDVSRVEHQIVTQFRDSSTGDRRELLSIVDEMKDKTKALGYNIQLVVFEKQSSIGSYFFCPTHHSIQHLFALYVGRQLRPILESVFSILLRESRRVRIKRLVWAHDDYRRCLEYFDKLREPMNEDDLFRQLPLELMERLLMLAFKLLFDDQLMTCYLVVDAEQVAYTTLAGVSSFWWQTLTGWPQSLTKRWLRHRLRRYIDYVCDPYRRCPLLVNELTTKRIVYGVAELDDRIFVVCSDTIEVFGPNGERQDDIRVKDLKQTRDIVSCTDTGSLYIAGTLRDWSVGVWRVSADGQSGRFLPNRSTRTTVLPYRLSVTSRRLLVTSDDDRLLLYGDDGAELKRVSLPDTRLQHGVETSRGTFVICHFYPGPLVSEVDDRGHVIRAFCDQQLLHDPRYLSTDGDGNVFVADYRSMQHVLLLNGELELLRVLLDADHDGLVPPWRLCYVQRTRRLVVGSDWSPCVQVFSVR